MRSSLKPKQALFVKEYLVDLNAKQAAIRAGYVPSRAEQTGCDLVRNRKVAAAIAEQQSERSVRLEISADRVVAELAKLGFANMLDYMRPNAKGDPVLHFSELTRDQAAALSEVTVETYVDGHGEDALDVKRVKFKLGDKIAALNSLGRHLGIFNDKLELSGRVTLEQLVNASFKSETA